MIEINKGVESVDLRDFASGKMGWLWLHIIFIVVGGAVFLELGGRSLQIKFFGWLY